jgi:hypothetical protein
VSAPTLSFRIAGAEPVPFSVAPQLTVSLAIHAEPESVPVHSILLGVQAQIQAQSRGYSQGEAASLKPLFGEGAVFQRALRSLHWCQTTVLVPSFRGSTRAGVALPCPLEFSAAVGTWFAALEEGSVPLQLLFRGTVFYEGPEGLTTAPVPWSAEANHPLPRETWNAAVKEHWPGCSLLALPRQSLERLAAFGATRGIATVEGALEKLLSEKAP